MPRIVIYVEGGQVNAVISDVPGLQFRVADHDLREDGETCSTQDSECDREQVDRAFRARTNRGTLRAINAPVR